MDSKLTPIEIRQYRPGDEVAILDCFNRIFSAVDVTFKPRELAAWRWQFEANPSGSHITLALTPEGKVVGQFAAIVQSVYFDGGRTLFSQGVDHMADRAYRRRFRYGTMLAQMGNEFARDFGGAGPDKVTLMWGAPVPAAWRTGQAAVRYEVIRTQSKLCCEPGKLRLGASSGVDVEELSEFPEDVLQLFEACTQAHRAIALRDKLHLDWRFKDHPAFDYRIACARRQGQLVGYAVYRKGDFDHQTGEGYLADWLVLPRDEAAAQALLAWFGAAAQADQVTRMTAVFPDSIPEWSLFQAAGFDVRPTNYFLIGRQYVRSYDMQWMHKHWYYTLGDTDLI